MVIQSSMWLVTRGECYYPSLSSRIFKYISCLSCYFCTYTLCCPRVYLSASATCWFVYELKVFSGCNLYLCDMVYISEADIRCDWELLGLYIGIDALFMWNIDQMSYSSVGAWTVMLSRVQLSLRCLASATADLQLLYSLTLYQTVLIDGCGKLTLTPPIQLCD